MLSYDLCVMLTYDLCVMYVCRLGHMTCTTNKPQIDYGHMTCLASKPHKSNGHMTCLVYEPQVVMAIIVYVTYVYDMF